MLLDGADQALTIVNPTFRNELTHLVKAGFQAFSTVTKEPARIMQIVRAVAADIETGDDNAAGYSVFIWDIARGLQSYRLVDADNFRTESDWQKGADDPMEILNKITTMPACPNTSHAIFVLLNYNEFLDDPRVRQQLENAVASRLCNCPGRRRPIYLAQSSNRNLNHVSHLVQPLKFQLPTRDEVTTVLEFMQHTTASAGLGECPPDLADSLRDAFLGLTYQQIEDVLALCLVRHKQWTPAMITDIRQKKAELLTQSGVLTYVPESTVPTDAEIGGFESLLGFVRGQAHAYSDAARKEKLDLPRGLVFIGPPGTGKSLAARGISHMLQEVTGRPFPAYFINVGAIFGSLVGESEANLEEMIASLEAQKGCVAIIDEVEKMFNSDDAGDSGVSRRVFGRLLQWMDTKTQVKGDDQDATYLVVTMNNIAGIPPEFFRRFDATFYTDLPDDETRRTILDIHFRRRGVETSELGLEKADWDALVSASKDMVGSELEDVVIQSRAAAFAARGRGVPDFNELHTAVADRRKSMIAELHKDRIEAMRAFVQGRARPVRGAIAKKPTLKPTKRALTLQ